MLYYARTIVKPEIPIVEPTGEEAAHAPVLLVESGVRIAARLRADAHFPVDVPDSPFAKICWAFTSIVRALGLEPACHGRLLDFFQSPVLDLDKLTRAWCALVFRFTSGILRVNRKRVLVGDGIKAAKAGRKMPGVKKLHRESGSNNKPEYILGHSCHAVEKPFGANVIRDRVEWRWLAARDDMLDAHGPGAPNNSIQ